MKNQELLTTGGKMPKPKRLNKKKTSNVIPIKKDVLEKGEIAIWRTEKELADCAKKVIYFDKGHKLNVHVQTFDDDDGPLTPSPPRILARMNSLAWWLAAGTKKIPPKAI